MKRCTTIFAGLFASLVLTTAAHAEDILLDPLLAGGGCVVPTHTYYLGVSWLGDIAQGEKIPYAFTRETLWDAQLPHEFTLLNPTPPPANVRIPAPGADATGEIAMGVVQILEDTHGDGRLDFTYDEINGPSSPVRGAVKEYWILYTHHLNDSARAALDMPFYNALTEGFNVIQGSASTPDKADNCPTHAWIVPKRVPMTMRGTSDTSPVCWGSN